MTLELDHLVIVAPSLDDGVRWCEQRLGVTPGPGGRHALMGTHNRLLRWTGAAFPQAYLEVIAIDPEAAAPTRTRWFGMDGPPGDPAPRLAHLVVRSGDAQATCDAMRRAGFDSGPLVAAERETAQGTLRWRISVRDDGHLQLGGACPTIIEWRSAHPAPSITAAPLELQRLVLRGVPRALRQALPVRGVAWADDAGPPLQAHWLTPLGPVRLDAPTAESRDD